MHTEEHVNAVALYLEFARMAGGQHAAKARLAASWWLRSWMTVHRGHGDLAAPLSLLWEVVEDLRIAVCLSQTNRHRVYLKGYCQEVLGDT